MRLQDEDRADIEASLAGDGGAYEHLVKRYEAQVAAQMWRFSRDPAVCEELVQDVFVEAYFSLATYRGRAPFLHWLKRIATRVGYRHWKKKSREKLLVPLHTFNEAEAPGDTMNPSTAAATLHHLLSRLRPADRLVMTLIYFDGCSTEEIAERMGWNRGMVKMRAHRARKKLREIAERENLAERLGWTH